MCEIAWLETVANVHSIYNSPDCWIHKTLHLSATTPRTFNSSLDLLSPAVGQWIKCAPTFFSSLDSYLPVYICTVIKIEHRSNCRKKIPLNFPYLFHIQCTFDYLHLHFSVGILIMFLFVYLKSYLFVIWFISFKLCQWYMEYKTILQIYKLVKSVK